MKPLTTDLINRCKAGDRQALNLLYLHYRPFLLNICKYTEEESVAEDLLHDTFIVILTSLDKLEKTDKPESWMRAIARNMGYHYRLHVKKEKMVLQQMAKESEPSKEEISTLDYDQLQNFISHLPKGYQQVFRLSVFEGLSHQEISQLLDIAPHSSSSQLTHAKRMLRLLIKQMWVLMLLLMTVPAALWLFVYNHDTTEQTLTIGNASEIEPTTSVEIPEEQSVYSQISSSSPSPSHRKSRSVISYRNSLQPVSYQNEVTIMLDSISYQASDSIIVIQSETAQTKDDESLKDTFTYQQIPPQLHKNQIVSLPFKNNHSWNVSVSFNGKVGQSEDFMASATIGKNSFDALANQFIPTDNQYNNWINYSNYLKFNPSIFYDQETRSMMKIAAQNASVNNGVVEAHYEHQPPITLQLMFSRQLFRRASIETGLSYSQLNSTITTGSTYANIQERQKLRYLGMPIRLGWTWFDKSCFRFYTSAGAMLELPLHSTVDVRHFNNGNNTFQKKTSPKVPVQWSTTFGLGIQYNIMSSLGIYLEPSIQYFFNNGSRLETYRTEHPLEFTLPIGIRYHW